MFFKEFRNKFRLVRISGSTAMIPAKPRKEPKQSRSKMLVQSVKDACRRVLY
jgi:hypothetical protein